MYPQIFGVIDSYVVMIIVGILASFALLVFYFKYKKFTKRDVVDLLICSSFAVAIGIVFALLFEALYELKWEWKLTFYGGLFGGIIGFLIVYFFFIRKNTSMRLDEVYIIAPAAITLGHAFGRVGCFLEGCCYGRETDSWIGIVFPSLNDGIKRIPTQLFESIFLFVLTIVLLVLIFKFKFKYTFIVYFPSYAIFRFVIEFFRDDPRGVSGVLSPSQIWSIIILVITIPFYIMQKMLVFKERKENVSE